MLTCSCIKREEWRDKFLKAITEILDNYGTPPPLQQLMMDGFRHTLGMQGTLNTHIPPHLAPLVTAQEAIGWTQMMKGRLAKEWKTQQQEAMQGNETKYKNSQTWSTEIIHTIFQHWLELWTIRNSDRHGRDWKTKRIAAKDQALREIAQLYEYKGRIMAQHEWIFHTSLDQQQQKSTYVLRAFINNFKPVILASYQT
jgi:hypothetical protein